jgi:glycosyltransferase involved in cell wall biosynthesis
LKKIMVVSAGPFTRQVGGGQSYTQDLVSGLVERGHNVIVLESMDSTIEEGEVLKSSFWNDIEVHSVCLPLQGETLEEQSSQVSILRTNLFCQILTKVEPDVVLINGLMQQMVRACNILGINYIVVAHHPGEVCPKGDLLTPKDDICREVPLPTVCGPCILQCKKGGIGVGRVLAKLPMKFHRQIGQILVRKNPLGYVGRVLYIPWMTEQHLLGMDSYLQDAKCIVAPSRAMATALIRAGAKAQRVTVINHGIHPLANTPISGLGRRPLRFGFVGRIDHAKGLHVLVKAMQMAKIEGKAELHVYGDATRPNDREDWYRVLKALGPAPWLYLHGKFERHYAAQIYATVDVLVLPSISPEIFGLVVAEALSAGRPVLSTRCGGPEDQIENNVNGWLVNPNDPLELSKQIQQLVANPFMVAKAAQNCKLKKSHGLYLDEIEKIFDAS